MQEIFCIQILSLVIEFRQSKHLVYGEVTMINRKFGQSALHYYSIDYLKLVVVVNSNYWQIENPGGSTNKLYCAGDDFFIGSTATRLLPKQTLLHL